MYLLDTNVVSETRKRRPHGAVMAWIAATPERDLHLSAMTLGEIQSGIEKTREQDADKAAAIEAWADQLASTFSILPMEAAAFRRWAKLMHRRPDDLYEDAMIAAIALVHDLTLVTRNVRDFKAFGVRLLDPFSTSAR